MKRNNREKKNASKFFNQKENPIQDKLLELIGQGKLALDQTLIDLGTMLVETILYIEREEISGADYHPKDGRLRKWASQPGSVYIGDRKTKISRPRLRDIESSEEIKLSSYEALKKPGAFSEEVLTKCLNGLSARKYKESIINASKSFGVSPSSLSRHFVEASAGKLKEFMERDLSQFDPFAIYLDTVHRGGAAFIVALGCSTSGTKLNLGFWEGSTENSEICLELLNDLQRRGLKLINRIIWVTDGGKGVIKALRESRGKKLIHVRCSIHKDRNIQRHLPKKYRKEAHRKFRTAIDQVKYIDAKAMLKDFEKWLRRINESAANSLLEALDELLTLHRLKVPATLRKSLHSTNPIESLFSMVRTNERNVKSYKGSNMAQRWLASILLQREASYRKIRGHQEIQEVLFEIDNFLNECVNECTSELAA